MRILALALLGGAVVLTMGCSSTRSCSRKAVLADHIASVRPDGSSYANATTTHARRAVPSTVTYASTAGRTAPSTIAPSSTARLMPAPPPPPAMPAVHGARPVTHQPAARAVTSRPVARPAARAATPVRRAPRNACKPKASGWKLFGGCCPGGT